MPNDNLIPVENKPGLFRDPVSGAIINTDTTGALAARKARAKALQRDQELQDLKEEVSELKSLIKQLIERQ